MAEAGVPTNAGPSGGGGNGDEATAQPGSSGTGVTGSAGSNSNCNVPESARCATTAIGANVTSSTYTTNGAAVTFSNGTDGWTSYTYVASGQTAPSVAAGADQLSIQANVASGSDANAYVAAGLYFANPSCANVSAYSAIRFTLSGDLGGCALRFSMVQSSDLHADASHPRGRCTDETCYGPSLALSGTGDIKVALSDLNNGVPCASLDLRSITGFAWEFWLPNSASSAKSCTANAIVSRVQFVK